MRKSSVLAIVVVGVVAVFAAFIATTAQQPREEVVGVDSDDLAGVVSGPGGPEAGVWVIAETSDLPTGFRKIVVTDDRGRYVVPDLPRASYRVWVRGYGLVDSRSVQAAPGRQVSLTAAPAPDAAAAAAYYPASYWYSLLHVPAKTEFPGTGPDGNGIAPTITSQAHWIEQIKTDSCESCHQLGNKATREIPASLGTFESSIEAWTRRIQSGQDGADMLGRIGVLGGRALMEFADWSDRIAAGELPPMPPRPQGLERNVVITQGQGRVDNLRQPDAVAHRRWQRDDQQTGPLPDPPRSAREVTPGSGGRG